MVCQPDMMMYCSTVACSPTVKYLSHSQGIPLTYGPLLCVSSYIQQYGQEMRNIQWLGKALVGA